MTRKEKQQELEELGYTGLEWADDREIDRRYDERFNDDDEDDYWNTDEDRCYRRAIGYEEDEEEPNYEDYDADNNNDEEDY